MITLKEAYEDLGNRMMKQIAEASWELERIKGIKEGSGEWKKFTGGHAKKKELIKSIEADIKERKKNLEVLKKLVKAERMELAKSSITAII